MTPERRTNVRHIGTHTFRDTPVRPAEPKPERVPEWIRRARLDRGHPDALPVKVWYPQ